MYVLVSVCLCVLACMSLCVPDVCISILVCVSVYMCSCLYSYACVCVSNPFHTCSPSQNVPEDLQR